MRSKSGRNIYAFSSMGQAVAETYVLRDVAPGLSTCLLVCEALDLKPCTENKKKTHT